MTEHRKKLAHLAHDTAERLQDAFGPGVRVVVVVTPESGDFVGVGSNTDVADVHAILRCALSGGDYTEHPRSAS